MDQYELVRTAHRIYGQNISELARATGHSRNTIKKALRGEHWGYKERDHQSFPALDPYLAIIDGWLIKDQEQPQKQRHTARRIFNRLMEEHDYQGGESTVRRYVRLAKVKLGIGTPKAFIPCDPEAGYEAEVDWGTAKAVIAGAPVQLKFFCMRSKYSGKHFVRFYPCERQQAFFDAHIQGFTFFGGIFPRLIYDNLTTAVRKVLLGHDRIEQDAFVKFRAYHSFEARFCNSGKGHEKGGVEGLVGFSRRNYMVPVPEAASLSDLNEQVLKRCLAYGNHKIAGREKCVSELFEEEKGHLLSLPEMVFSNLLTYDGRVDKYATVILDKNRYSAPTGYVGFKVKAVLGVDKVEIFFGTKKLAVHERLYGNNKWSLIPDHYLDLLYQRPMAFHSARPILQWRQKWPEAFNTLLSRFCEAHGETSGIKEFISVLMLFRGQVSGDVEAAVELALKNTINSSQGVRHILIYNNEHAPKTASLPNWQSLPEPDITIYNQLGGVQ
jgi:transposase